MEYEKYIHVLAMLNSPPQLDTEDDWHHFFDEVFTYIHTNFSPPSKEFQDEYAQQMKQTKEILCNRKLSHEILKRIPPDFLETTFPIAVASFILCSDKNDGGFAAPVERRKLETFPEFHARYGDLILFQSKKN